MNTPSRSHIVALHRASNNNLDYYYNKCFFNNIAKTEIYRTFTITCETCVFAICHNASLHRL